MKLRRALIAACLALLALPAAISSAQGSAPQPLAELTIPDSAYAKLPRVAADAGSVYVAANTARRSAALFARPAGADAFSPPEILGPAEGHPDYSTASVAAAPDGRLVYAWINQPQRTIYARVRAPGGAWGPARVVVAGSPFPVYLAVAATERDIVVVWRDPDRPVVFSRSADGGATWSPPAAVSEQAGVTAPALAAGPGGVIAVAYTQAEARRLQVFAGVWNGRSFDVRRISSTAGDFADPGVAVLADGRVAVAYRGVAESGSASGVFFAERSPDGAWPVARLVEGKVIGPVAAAGDPQGGLNLFWVGSARRRSQVWYARRPRAAAWSAPAGSRSAGDDTIFNVHGAVAAAPDGALNAHAASEYFSGDTTFVRAYRFLAGAGGAPPVVAARPLLESGASASRASSLAVAFVDIAGAPAEVRWRWDAAPGDADPWQPFAPSIVVPPPPGDGCGERVLFTQVRGAGAISRPASDAIVLDPAVQASMRHLPLRSAPGSTSMPYADVEVDAAADCSGLSSASLAGGGAATITGSVGVLRADLLAATDKQGPREIVAELADGLGNTRLLSTTVVYDREPPAVEVRGPVSVRSDSGATIFQTLRLEDVTFVDNLSAAPWALNVMVTEGVPSAPNLYRDVLVPIAPGDLQRAPDGTFTVEVEINLADLFGWRHLAPGTYTFVAFPVDAAGNHSLAAGTATATLDAITYPRVALPLLHR
jgi:hypothetical protein